MKIRCKDCGVIFEVQPNSFNLKNKERCDKCARKANIATQEELAQKAGRTIVDNVQAASDAADKLGLSYGKYMAMKWLNNGDRSKSDARKTN